MNKLSPLKAGIAFGSVLGLWHFAWAMLVAANLAKPLMDWVLKLHFISVPYAINSFEWRTAATLVLLTAFIGYTMGFVFALIWNLFAK